MSVEEGGAPFPHRTMITVSIMLASVLQALDNTIANVALPRIQGSMSATQDQMAWVLTSYIIAAAIMTPLSGWLAGRVGRKRIFVISVVGFTLASMLCGMAQTLPEIVLARIAQGMCGAALVPMSQAVLLDINPPSQHARAMSIWVMGVTVGPIIGPALGGWLTENYNWRWVFYINVPLGVLSLAGILAFMPESKIRKMPFDFFGFAALSCAIGALQLVFDRGQLKDWFSSTEVIIEAVVAGLGFYLFIVHMMTTRKEPFVSPALFRNRNFVAGNVFIFVLGIVLFATLALLPPLLQKLMDYPVVLTGLITAPRGIGTLISMLIVSKLIGKIDTRIVIGTGFLLTVVALEMMTNFYLQMDTMPVILSGLLQGVGTGFVFIPLAAVTFATLSPALRSEGTAFFSLVRNVGSGIGISLVQIVLTRNTQIMHARLAEHVTPYGDPSLGNMPLDLASTHGLIAADALVNQQASMIAYNNDFKLMMIMTLCTIPLIFLLQNTRSKPEAGTVVVE